MELVKSIDQQKQAGGVLLHHFTSFQLETRCYVPTGNKNKIRSLQVVLVLSREWMGMGVAGMIISIVIMDHSLIP